MIRKEGSRFFRPVVSVTALRDEDDVIIGYLLIARYTARNSRRRTS